MMASSHKPNADRVNARYKYACHLKKNIVDVLAYAIAIITIKLTANADFRLIRRCKSISYFRII